MKIICQPKFFGTPYCREETGEWGRMELRGQRNAERVKEGRKVRTEKVSRAWKKVNNTPFPLKDLLQRSSEQ